MESCFKLKYSQSLEDRGRVVVIMMEMAMVSGDHNNNDSPTLQLMVMVSLILKKITMAWLVILMDAAVVPNMPLCQCGYWKRLP